MTSFLVLAALMTLATIVIAIAPLLYKKKTIPNQPHSHVQEHDPSLHVLRDQLHELDKELAYERLSLSEYTAARQELERRVAQDVSSLSKRACHTSEQLPIERRNATLIAISVPILASALYLMLGNLNGLDPAQVAAPQDKTHSSSNMQIEAMVAALAQRLETDPSNADGWHMLARSYSSLGKFKQATKAYAHLAQLLPDDADVFAAYADTMATAQDNNLQGEPERLINHALALDPNNIKALALSGSAGFERQDYDFAIRQWQKILALLPKKSEMHASIEASIEEAKQAKK